MKEQKSLAKSNRSLGLRWLFDRLSWADSRIKHLLILAFITSLSGCTYLKYNNYLGERFLRGTGGHLLMVASGVIGCVLVFLTRGSTSRSEVQLQKVFGVVLLLLCFLVGIYKFYIGFHYTGRREPYPWP